MSDRAPRVVAELGRPETPEETAARKAENSRKHRQRQTVKNLVLALGASLALVLGIVLLVPRSNTAFEPNVDIAAVAQQAQPGFPAKLVVPKLPSGWTPNAADVRNSKADGVTAWYIGELTPGKEYIGLYQATGANPTWVANLTARGLASGTVPVGGLDWTIYDNRKAQGDVGNAKYALVAETHGQTIALVGTASPDEFATLAAAVAESLKTS